VGNCVANQWFRFALGRMEANDDACALAALQSSLAASGNVRELIRELVRSEAFRYVRATGGTP
jgi:deoxyhypusine synthase